MQFITGKHMPRRRFIQGVGATLALPFLDAMVPAGRLWGKTPFKSVDKGTRLICIEEVHGLALGIVSHIHHQAPAGRVVRKWRGQGNHDVEVARGAA